MGYTAAIPDNVKPFISCFQIIVNLNLHIVEFDFHTIEQGIIVCRTRRNLINA